MRNGATTKAIIGVGIGAVIIVLAYASVQLMRGDQQGPEIADGPASAPSEPTSSNDDAAPPDDDGATDPAGTTDPAEAALRAANDHPDIDFEAAHTTEASIGPLHLPDADVEAFADHEFVYVWSPLAHTENAPFAVSPAGQAYLLPDELTALARDEDLTLEGDGDAEALFRYQLLFEPAVPETDEVLVVDEIGDVPDIDADDARRHDSQVRPLSVEPRAEGWQLEASTWRRVGGVLERWVVHIDDDGGIDVRERETIAEGLGQDVGVE
jgi:hypothetical protein